MKYQEYFLTKVAPSLNEIFKERDQIDLWQVRQLLRSVRDLMNCETVAYFTCFPLEGERFFIPEGYMSSETQFPASVEVPFTNALLRDAITSGRYVVKDTAADDDIGSPFDSLGIKSVIAAPAPEEFPYGVLFGFNGRSIEKSQFKVSFNYLQCNLFLLISRAVELPLPFEVNLADRLQDSDDQLLSRDLLETLADVREREVLIDGMKTYYKPNREIDLLLLTPSRILSVVQKAQRSACSAFYLSDVASVNEKTYVRRGEQRIDIELEFKKGRLALENLTPTLEVHRLLRSIRFLTTMNKPRSRFPLVSCE